MGRDHVLDHNNIPRMTFFHLSEFNGCFIANFTKIISKLFGGKIT